MIIDCVSDLHGFFPKFEGGDLLIVAGDLTRFDNSFEYADILEYLSDQDYKKVIVVAGNHDNKLENMIPPYLGNNLIYLMDSGVEFEGLKIWGSPWTQTFDGMNPHCKAFTVDTEKELNEKWKLIPIITDILITHGPPKFGLDRTIDSVFAGSESLRSWIFENQPRLHIFGHIHESYGKLMYEDMQNLSIEITGKPEPDLAITSLINASHVNERYQPVNKPIRVIL